MSYIIQIDCVFGNSQVEQIFSKNTFMEGISKTSQEKKV